MLDSWKDKKWAECHFSLQKIKNDKICVSNASTVMSILLSIKSFQFLWSINKKKLRKHSKYVQLTQITFMKPFPSHWCLLNRCVVWEDLFKWIKIELKSMLTQAHISHLITHTRTPRQLHCCWISHLQKYIVGISEIG